MGGPSRLGVGGVAAVGADPARPRETSHRGRAGDQVQPGTAPSGAGGAAGVRRRHTGEHAHNWSR